MTVYRIFVKEDKRQTTLGKQTTKREKGLHTLSNRPNQPKEITSSRDSHDPLAIWRAGPTKTHSPHGYLVCLRPAHHMASWSVQGPLIIWRDCPSRAPLVIWRAGPTKTRSPYGEPIFIIPLIIWRAVTAPYQFHALSSRLCRLLLRASATLSLVSSRLELPLKLYDKTRKGLFSQLTITVNLTP